jgi:O-succinylbenzoic acid--CoA ligase
MTPYQYEKALLEFPSQLMKIKTVLLGGAAISESLKSKIVLNNQRVFHSYGMTETYSHVALKQIDNQNQPFQFLEGISGKKVSDNTLILHAPKLGIEALKTNDIVHFIDYNHFDFLGRIDFVVNSGGIKLHPEELEKKLGVLEWEFNYFFFGLPDETLGEKLVLFVESQHVVELNAFGNLLTKYELPKEVLFLERFEYTESGKINRNLTVKNYLS